MLQFYLFQIWEACSDARISFNHDGMQDDVAFIVENDVILNALTNTLNDMSDNIDVLRGMKANDYILPATESDLVTVSLQNGVPLKTKLLVFLRIILIYCQRNTIIPLY